MFTNCYPFSSISVCRGPGEKLINTAGAPYSNECVGDVSKFERGIEAPIGEFQNPRLPLDPATAPGMDYADQGKGGAGGRGSNSHFRFQNL